MKTVQIVETFTLTRNDGSQQRFTPGVYELEDEYADFWYVVAHSKNAPPPNPPVGTQEYAALEQKKIARRKILEAAAEELAEQATEDAVAEQTATTRRRILDAANKPVTTKALKS